MNTRNRLIGYLKENKGQWVSGEWLSSQLGVSRTTISKQIRRLREAGYPITAATRNGYRLEEVPDVLEPAEIRDGLDAPILGQGPIHCLGEADSTNLQAKMLAEKGAPEGTLVLADHQTRGRGRKSRTWDSPAGIGIYMSIILRPTLPPVEAPSITLVAGVSLAEVLIGLTDLPARIKWPNDILIKGKKIAGILTELTTAADTVNYVVVGLGLNVNAVANDLAPEIRPIATSIRIETGRQYSRADLIRAFLKRFDRDYAQWQAEGFAAMRDRWKALTDIIGRRVRVEMIGRLREGVVVDIDQDGLLILEDQDGNRRSVISGDVVFI